MKKIVLLSAITLLLLNQCTEETLDGVDMGYGYFPTTEGQFLTYDVDSIVWNPLVNLKAGTFRYKVKLRIEDAFEDEAKRTIHRWVKYVKSDTTPWQVDRVFGAIVEPSYLEINENNLPVVRLAFPTSLGHKWDMNAFNMENKSESTLIELDEAKSINGLQFDSTCTVLIIEDDPGYVRDDYVYDVFVKNIGLAERYERFLSTTFSGEIEEGYILHYKVKDFGVE